jgi:predicted transcriptional regulator
VFETVARQRAVLALLSEESLDKASVVRRLDVSRSTVNRAISTLESYGFVERVDGRYRTTTAGDVARRLLRETLATVEGLTQARPLLAYADDLDPPPALFRDATVVTADEDPHGPVRFLVDLLEDASTVRSAGAVFRNAVPAATREQLAEGEYRKRMVMSPETVERAQAYHEPELRELVASPRHELRISDGRLGTTMAVVDAGVGEAVTVVFYDEADEPVGLVHTSDPGCLAWARELIDREWERSTPAETVLDYS